jgi:hypothetical protein
MNWEAVGAVGEIIGAVAVIVSIIYLALQVRQNTGALRSSATNSASEGAAALYQTLCRDPDLAMIFVRGNAAPEKLTDAEMAQYFSLWLMTLFKVQNWYFQTQDQFMDDTLLSSWVKVLRPISSTPGFQLFWNERKFIFSPQFQEYLQAEVFEANPTPDFKSLGVNPNS